ncbi:hypothetical protein SDC9_121539 [bioreactor metagenome]|uniref:Uncharacterized protein n=1 Tax=bioreactor metagenome TaxID=1076179 RepID=A0A645CCA2_9ZZZZ
MIHNIKGFKGKSKDFVSNNQFGECAFISGGIMRSKINFAKKNRI